MTLDLSIELIVNRLEDAFDEHRFTGDRQNIVAEVVKWLLSEQGGDMSVGELRGAIRKGCSDILE